MCKFSKYSYLHQILYFELDFLIKDEDDRGISSLPSFRRRTGEDAVSFFFFLFFLFFFFSSPGQEEDRGSRGEFQKFEPDKYWFHPHIIKGKYQKQTFFFFQHLLGSDMKRNVDGNFRTNTYRMKSKWQTFFQIRRWSGVWEDGIPGNVTSFLPQTSFWPEQGNDDSLQVMMMIRRRRSRQLFTLSIGK